MQSTGFASKAQNETWRCTNCRSCTQLSDAPICARILVFLVERQPSQSTESSAGQAMRTRGTGEAHGVGIRSRRQIFHGRWLANHSYNQCRWSSSTAEAVLARARSMCLDYLLPSVHGEPFSHQDHGGSSGGSLDGLTRFARLLLTIPTFGPGKIGEGLGGKGGPFAHCR
jgi:hypothetical protein